MADKVIAVDRSGRNILLIFIAISAMPANVKNFIQKTASLVILIPHLM